MVTPSFLALVLTLALALLSALAFVLLYLRSPWAASAASSRGNKSHLHSHSHLPGHQHLPFPMGGGGGAGATGSGNGAGMQGGAAGSGAMCGHAHGTSGHADSAHGHSHHHAHSHSSPNRKASGHALHQQHHHHSPTAHHQLSAAEHAQMLSHGGAASNSSSSLTQSSTGGGAHSHAPPLPGGGALTAADIALRGRKAKKRGGRVHVMLGASGSGGSGGGGGGGSGGSHAVHGPASTGSSRGRGASLASPSPYVYPLDFLSAAPPVIVCVSTLPSRVHHIDKTLNSIKTQNYPIAQMLLVIPEESRRERTKYSIPDRVRKDAILSVVRVSHDYGPATALISAWAAAAAADPSADHNHAFLGHRDTMIIRLDDDMVYHPDTVATLVRHALAHPDSAVGFAGYSLRGPPYGQPNLQFAKRREERTDIQWRNTQQALQHQINYAAATAPPGSSVALAAAAAAAAAAHASSSSYSSHLLSPSLDPSLLPVFDPLPDVCLESDPYLSPLPNPNDVYDTELVDVLQSWRGGMLVRKRFLDERLWKEYADAPADAAMEADDEWVSAQLARNGVARRVILAPFDMILSRLRLRHGRHSASASHIAHQQTMLEALVARGMLTPRLGMGVGSQQKATAVDGDEDEAKTEQQATTATEVAHSFEHLIRTVSVDSRPAEG